MDGQHIESASTEDLSDGAEILPREENSILVVDDDEAVRLSVVDLLEEEGYVVFQARDGIDALELLDSLSRPPSLLLIDLMMPRLNGWELLETLRQDDELSLVPVAVMTAVPDHCPVEVRCVEKPFNFNAILQLLRPAH